MNKPVAWMLKTEKGLSGIVWNEEDLEKEKQLFKEWEWDCAVVPLYTHPTKELTDEEVTELENALEVCDYKYFGSYEFSENQWAAFEVLEKHAKAILRKAQEK